MIVILDNGHGSNTPGKQSPDGKLREYSYTREIVKGIYNRLKELGIESVILVPEEEDISLSERSKRANKIDPNNSILISIHCNAAGNGSCWMNGAGWEAYTYPGESKADELATFLYESARECLPDNIKLRTDYSDGDPDKESSFYILKYTKCPAVLTENLFQDNLKEMEYLLSDEGKKSIIELHVRGVCRYIMKYCKNN